MNEERLNELVEESVYAALDLAEFYDRSNLIQREEYKKQLKEQLMLIENQLTSFFTVRIQQQNS